MSYGVAVSIGLALGAFAFAYLSVNFKDIHSPLKWLFMILSVSMVSFNTLISSEIANKAGYEAIGNMTAWVAYGLLIILVFVIAYFLIFFITRSLEKTGKPAYGEGSD